MRYIEIMSGIPTVLSNEEKEIYDREEIKLSDLDERSAEVATQMHRKGILHMLSDQDTLIPNVWT